MLVPHAQTPSSESLVSRVLAMVAQRRWPLREASRPSRTGWYVRSLVRTRATRYPHGPSEPESQLSSWPRGRVLVQQNSGCLRIQVQWQLSSCQWPRPRRRRGVNVPGPRSLSVRTELAIDVTRGPSASVAGWRFRCDVQACGCQCQWSRCPMKQPPAPSVLVRRAV